MYLSDDLKVRSIMFWLIRGNRIQLNGNKSILIESLYFDKWNSSGSRRLSCVCIIYFSIKILSTFLLLLLLFCDLLFLFDGIFFFIQFSKLRNKRDLTLYQCRKHEYHLFGFPFEMPLFMQNAYFYCSTALPYICVYCLKREFQSITIRWMLLYSIEFWKVFAFFSDVVVAIAIIIYIYSSSSSFSFSVCSHLSEHFVDNKFTLK